MRRVKSRKPRSVYMGEWMYIFNGLAAMNVFSRVMDKKVEIHLIFGTLRFWNMKIDMNGADH